MRARDVFEYNKLTWPEMNDAIEMQKVVILPTGSTEQHGPHMPLDVDLFLGPGGLPRAGPPRPRPGARSCPPSRAG
ncbi:MAG: creatininase family protein [Ignavibacteriales bacterium]|nr:creatininase family protein [Ignavibacteriales bacterium]